ncbi:TagK domain-containing protein [Cronobacter dublinensis]|uniref:TagK domain-containing protein n=1 Tax=Cronobacter dublinensis TaxID=413497 RepID=UPI000CFD3763|nr:TagK domain-containing protein [Cronobacter dublinensis]
MRIRFTWPENGAEIALNEHHDEAWLDLDCGELRRSGDADMANGLCFSLRGAQPVMTLFGTDYVCLAGGESLAPGQAYPLRYGLALQAGRFALQVAMAKGADAAWLTNDTSDWAVREVDALLARSAGYVDWRHFNGDRAATPADDDILKSLEKEYKRFLAWGEQSREAARPPVAQRTRLKYAPSDFTQLREQTKDKTLTECILGSSALIAQACEALSGLEADPGLFDEPRYDVMKIVAPEYHAVKEHARLPALTVREFHQPDLDSLL